MAQYLNPFSGRQFLDANGDPYVGAKLFTYVAGSSTKTTCTKDSAGASNHANPIILNARGEPGDGSGASQAIWQTGGVSVKLVLAPSTDTDPPLSPIATWDNLTGVNDTSITVDQWISGPTPTYISATQFSLVGDQTSAFHVGRRVKATVTAGTVYGVITVSAYAAVTTVTVVLDSGSLDSGLSAVSYGILTATNPSIPGVELSGNAWTHQGNVTHEGTVTMTSKSIWMAEGANVASASDCNIWTTDGNTVHVTGTTTITDWGTAPQAGVWKRVIFDGALTLTHNATTNDLPGGLSFTTRAGDSCVVYARSASSYKVVEFTPYLGRSALCFINGQSASSSAFLDFSGYLNTAFSSYLYSVEMLVPATNNTALYMRGSIDGGSTFLTGASDYQHANTGYATTATVIDSANSGANTIVLTGAVNILNTSDQGGYNADLILYNPSNTTRLKQCVFNATYATATPSWAVLSGMGLFSGASFSTNDVDAIRFLMSSGNIASGNIYLYGRRI